MKLHNKSFSFLLFSFLTIIFLYSCKSKIATFYYDDRIEKTEDEKIAHDIYFNDVPKEQQKTDKDVLIIFNAEAFKGKTVIINKKNSLSFDSSPNPSGCYGILFKKIPKSAKKIKLSVDGKKDIYVPIIDKYDYIYIGDATKSKWGISYSKNFPSFSCM